MGVFLFSSNLFFLQCWLTGLYCHSIHGLCKWLSLFNVKFWPFRRPIEETLKLLPGPHSDTKRVSTYSWNYFFTYLCFLVFWLQILFHPLHILIYCFYLLIVLSCWFYSNHRSFLLICYAAASINFGILYYFYREDLQVVHHWTLCRVLRPVWTSMSQPIL